VTLLVLNDLDFGLKVFSGLFCLLYKVFFDLTYLLKTKKGSFCKDFFVWSLDIFYEVLYDLVNTGFELKYIISPAIAIKELKVNFLNFNLIDLINFFGGFEAIIIEIDAFCILIWFIYFINFFLLIFLVRLIKFWFCSTFIIFHREL
jgi:hypothetical protein